MAEVPTVEKAVLVLQCKIHEDGEVVEVEHPKKYKYWACASCIDEISKGLGGKRRTICPGFLRWIPLPRTVAMMDRKQQFIVGYLAHHLSHSMPNITEAQVRFIIDMYTVTTGATTFSRYCYLRRLIGDYKDLSLEPLSVVKKPAEKVSLKVLPKRSRQRCAREYPVVGDDKMEEEEDQLPFLGT